jgi:hypothetical protein
VLFLELDAQTVEEEKPPNAQKKCAPRATFANCDQSLRAGADAQQHAGFAQYTRAPPDAALGALPAYGARV